MHVKFGNTLRIDKQMLRAVRIWGSKQSQEIETDHRVKVEEKVQECNARGSQ